MGDPYSQEILPSWEPVGAEIVDRTWLVHRCSRSGGVFRMASWLVGVNWFL